MLFWCHIRYLNSLKIHPERKTKADKKMVNDLAYEGIEFPVSKRDHSWIEQNNNICINIFCYEHGLIYPVDISDERFLKGIDLLMITHKTKTHHVYIKDFNRFMGNRTKCKSKKNTFADIVYNVLVMKEFF